MYVHWTVFIHFMVHLPSAQKGYKKIEVLYSILMIFYVMSCHTYILTIFMSNAISFTHRRHPPRSVKYGSPHSMGKCTLICAEGTGRKIWGTWSNGWKIFEFFVCKIFWQVPGSRLFNGLVIFLFFVTFFGPFCFYSSNNLKILTFVKIINIRTVPSHRT